MSFIDYADYFQHTDQKFREEFLNIGKSLNQYSTEISYSEQNSDLIIFFESKTEFRNKHIVENGEIVGHYRMAEPYYISISRGSFLVKNYSNLKLSKNTQYALYAFELRKKGLFRRKPKIILHHKNLRLEVCFDTLIPLSII